jgi:hypothetical protein
MFLKPTRKHEGAADGGLQEGQRGADDETRIQPPKSRLTNARTGASIFSILIPYSRRPGGGVLNYRNLPVDERRSVCLVGDITVKSPQKQRERWGTRRARRVRGPRWPNFV